MLVPGLWGWSLQLPSHWKCSSDGFNSVAPLCLDTWTKDDALQLLLVIRA